MSKSTFPHSYWTWEDGFQPLGSKSNQGSGRAHPHYLMKPHDSHSLEIWKTSALTYSTLQAQQGRRIEPPIFRLVFKSAIISNPCRCSEKKSTKATYLWSSWSRTISHYYYLSSHIYSCFLQRNEIWVSAIVCIYQFSLRRKERQFMKQRRSFSYSSSSNKVRLSKKNVLEFLQWLEIIHASGVNFFYSM